MPTIDVLDTTGHLHPRARRRHAARLRKHRHVARPILDPIDAIRDERHAPGVSNDAVDGDGPIVVAAGVVFDAGDVRRVGGARRGARENNSEHRDANEVAHMNWSRRS